jgi:hypothetical protein
MTEEEFDQSLKNAKHMSKIAYMWILFLILNYSNQCIKRKGLLKDLYCFFNKTLSVL